MLKIFPVLAILLVISFAQSKPAASVRKPPVAAKAGIKTPGVQIPFASLKAELEFPVTDRPAWIASAENILIPTKDSVERIDPKLKEAKFGQKISGLENPCGGAVSAFSALWVPGCGVDLLEKIDSKTSKVLAKGAVGTSSAHRAIAATEDSIWMFTDDRTTLTRIDPDSAGAVAELRLPASCTDLLFAETALWAACPVADKLLRIDPKTNLVDKTIKTSGEPASLAASEGSIWVYCRKEGVIERIDPKTNKSTAKVELGIPGEPAEIAAGEGFVWATSPGFPLMRIDPQTEKVAQQFFGEGGGGALLAAQGWIWMANPNGKSVLKIDPKRVLATLAE